MTLAKEAGERGPPQAFNEVRVMGGSGRAALFGAAPGLERVASVAMEADGDEFSIVLLNGRNLPLLRLGPLDEDDIVAVWRAISDASGLPLTVLLPNGAVARPFEQLGRLRIGSAHPRRRTPVLNGRRPRFLVRRKGARLPSRPLIYREREMAAGRGR